MPALKEIIEAELAEAEQKAWDSLSRYKFQMFGYWAAIWVHLNRISGAKRKNPWGSLVTTAKVMTERNNGKACPHSTKAQ